MRDMPTGRGAWQRLAQQVVEERAARGWTQTDVAERGGFSVDRLQEIEKGSRTKYRPTTLGALERGLRWESGSVRRVLQGEAPVRVAEATEPASTTPLPDRESPVVLSQVAAAILADTELIEEARRHLLNQYELLRRLTPSPVLSERTDRKTPSHRADDLPRDDDLLEQSRREMDAVRGRVRKNASDTEEERATGKKASR